MLNENPATSVPRPPLLLVSQQQSILLVPLPPSHLHSLLLSLQTWIVQFLSVLIPQLLPPILLLRLQELDMLRGKEETGVAIMIRYLPAPLLRCILGHFLRLFGGFILHQTTLLATGIYQENYMNLWIGCALFLSLLLTRITSNQLFFLVTFVLCLSV